MRFSAVCAFAARRVNYSLGSSVLCHPPICYVPWANELPELPFPTCQVEGWHSWLVGLCLGNNYAKRPVQAHYHSKVASNARSTSQTGLQSYSSAKIQPALDRASYFHINRPRTINSLRSAHLPQSLTRTSPEGQ